MRFHHLMKLAHCAGAECQSNLLLHVIVDILTLLLYSLDLVLFIATISNLYQSGSGKKSIRWKEDIVVIIVLVKIISEIKQ